MILASNFLSLFAISFLIFFPWKKGPSWYLAISPAIFFTMMYLNYIILPGVNAALFVYYTVNPNYDLVTFPLESWIVFFSILCITRMGEYWFSLKKIVLDDARIYMQSRKQQKLDEEAARRENSPEQEQHPMDRDMDEQELKALRKVQRELENETKDYMMRVRSYGEGEVRIGETLSLNDDIYSIGFIS